MERAKIIKISVVIGLAAVVFGFCSGCKRSQLEERALILQATQRKQKYNSSLISTNSSGGISGSYVPGEIRAYTFDDFERDYSKKSVHYSQNTRFIDMSKRNRYKTYEEYLESLEEK